MKQKDWNIILLLLLLAARTVSAQVINAGVGGNNTINLLERLDADVLKKGPDLVILMVGTNDMLNSKKMISYRAYEDNLKKIINKIREKDANILLMAPPTADSVYLFQRHNKKAYQEIPNVKLDSIRQIIKRIAHENNLGFIDLYHSFHRMGLPKHNQDLFLRNERNSGANDGVHPTALGYRYIAEIVFDYLKFNKLLNKNHKIVCFGDSITKGSDTKNSSTSIGENYPAVLSRLLLDYFEKE